MSRDDFPPFDGAQGALSQVEARTAEAGRGRPVPARRVHGSGNRMESADISGRRIDKSICYSAPASSSARSSALSRALAKSAGSRSIGMSGMMPTPSKALPSGYR